MSDPTVVTTNMASAKTTLLRSPPHGASLRLPADPHGVLARRATASGRTSRTAPRPRSPPRQGASATRRPTATRATSPTRRRGCGGAGSSVRVPSSQSARSQIPGSRSRNRPCVSAMSSADGVKTSKTNRPCPVARRRGHGPKSQSPILVRLHVEQRAEGADHERERLVDRRVAHVAVTQVDLDPRECRALARHLEHPGRQVDADHADPGSGDRHRDPARSDAELQHRAARSAPPRRRRTARPRRRSATMGRRPGRSCRRRTRSYPSTDGRHDARSCLAGPGAQPGTLRSAFLQPHRGLT